MNRPRYASWGHSCNEPSMAAWWNARYASWGAWWNANRKEFLKLATWELLEKQICNRFMPKGSTSLSRCVPFSCVLRETSPLPNTRLPSPKLSHFIQHLQVPAPVPCPSYSRPPHCRHPGLRHRQHQIDNINVDDLSALMSMQYESLAAEGNLGRMWVRQPH